MSSMPSAARRPSAMAVTTRSGPRVLSPPAIFGWWRSPARPRRCGRHRPAPRHGRPARPAGRLAEGKDDLIGGVACSTRPETDAFNRLAPSSDCGVLIHQVHPPRGPCLPGRGAVAASAGLTAPRRRLRAQSMALSPPPSTSTRLPFSGNALPALTAARKSRRRARRTGRVPPGYRTRAQGAGGEHGICAPAAGGGRHHRHAYSKRTP
jgi:hypothetical protein